MANMLLKNCNLIDGISNDIRENRWVLIKDNRITDIGCSKRNPVIDENMEVIDVNGQYVMPGLINLHVHIQRRNLHYKNQSGTFKQRAGAIANSSETKRMLLSLKNAWDELQHGCTTIRDVSSKDRITNTLRDCINEGVFRGPRILASGYGIACTGGHGTHAFNDSIEADGADGFRKAVRYEIKCGADLVKFKGGGGLGSMPKEHPYWTELTYEELQAGIEEAHKRGKTTTIHAMGTETIVTALRAGIDGIEHGCCLDEEALDLMCERNVYFVPTMSGITGVAEREKESGNPAIAEIMFRDVVWKQRDSVREAFKRGILIGCGTDTQGDMLIELDLMRQCGLPAMESLKTATSNAAKICGMSDEIGTIEAGKLADIIIVKKNPLEDVHALNELDMVIRDGVPVTGEWMCNLANW